MTKMLDLHPDTGVSCDFYGHFCGLNAVFYTPGGRERVAELVRKYPLRTYEERYPTSKYEDVITPRNRHAVEVLDRIVRIANRRLVDSETFTDEFFIRLAEKARKLVYANRHIF